MSLERSTDDEDAIKVPAAAPLFPLPDGVLFPQLVQPLHIFEPRYRELTAWCLERDSPFVLCSLRPDADPDLYETKQAPIRPLGCLARIAIHKQLPDGRYLLVVRGLSRVEIVGELDQDEPFRIGRLIARPDEYSPVPGLDRFKRRKELLDLFFGCFPKIRENGSLCSLLESELPLGMLCDLLAYSSRMTAREMYAVLCCLDVDRRSELVLRHLQLRPVWSSDAIARDRPFPPPFSVN